jgi:PTH1 family peptidyl-tRNA hydrolase
MKLIVGLGNPGTRYANTRHNIGARVVAMLHTSQIVAFGPWKPMFKADVAEGRLGNEKVALMLPQTYMNDSGEAVIEAVNFWKLTPADVLVVLDDLALPLGRIRIRREGSSGGQNGLKDILARLSTEAIPRVRVGIGSTYTEGTPAEDSVLQRFAKEELVAAEKAIETARDAVIMTVTESLEAAMNKYNVGEETK